MIVTDKHSEHILMHKTEANTPVSAQISKSEVHSENVFTFAAMYIYCVTNLETMI